MKKDYIVLSAGELLGRNTMLKDYNGLVEKVNQKIKKASDPEGPYRQNAVMRYYAIPPLASLDKK